MAAYTEADLAQIRKCIASGIRTVQFSDRSQTFSTMSDLLQAEAKIAASLSARPRQRLGNASKGFDL